DRGATCREPVEPLGEPRRIDRLLIREIRNARPVTEIERAKRAAQPFGNRLSEPHPVVVLAEQRVGVEGLGRGEKADAGQLQRWVRRQPWNDGVELLLIDPKGRRLTACDTRIHLQDDRGTRFAPVRQGSQAFSLGYGPDMDLADT